MRFALLVCAAMLSFGRPALAENNEVNPISKLTLPLSPPPALLQLRLDLSSLPSAGGPSSRDPLPLPLADIQHLSLISQSLTSFAMPARSSPQEQPGSPAVQADALKRLSIAQQMLARFDPAQFQNFSEARQDEIMAELWDAWRERGLVGDGKVSGIMNKAGPIMGQDKQVLNDRLPALLHAENVGRKPSDEERRRIEGWFPKLAGSDWRVTGPECAEIDCFAWAIGEPNENVKVAEWLGLDREGVFRVQYGLRPMSLESEADVAEFSSYPGSKVMPTHWSRHLSGDWWESKLGGNLRIIHHLHDLEGERYGWVHNFYRKSSPAGGGIQQLGSNLAQ